MASNMAISMQPTLWIETFVKRVVLSYYLFASRAAAPLLPSPET